jgi:hypothetical protein
LEKHNQSPAFKENQFIEICLTNLDKDGSRCCFT